METVMLGLEIARRMAVRTGPYLLVEMVMPGGTLVALLLYWYRRKGRVEKNPESDVEWSQVRSTIA